MQLNTFHISTFGCQMNLADSSTLVANLLTRGYQRVEHEKDADLLIFNTCSVREKAEERVIGRLWDVYQFKKNRPSVKIAVVGCMAQRLGEKLREVFPHVDYILGTDRFFELPDVIQGREGTSPIMIAFGHENMDIIEPVRENAFSGFVTISRGCDNFCTYCIVPYVRGPERTHSADFIVDNVKKMVDQGVVEITLLGQNVNSYRWHDTDFPDLLKRVASETAIRRIRFMTSHPKDLSRRLVDIMAENEKLMPHIHLPLQSGSNRILEKMGRNYSIEHYNKIVDYIRSKLDYVCITTDLIVGFPSETEAEFESTLAAVRDIQYDSAFMFRYSVRPGTAAAGYDDDVSEEDKIRRLNKLIEIQKHISYERNQREIGRTCLSVVEGLSRRSDDFLRARTEGNKTVLFKADNVRIGEIIPITVESADAFTLHGAVREVKPV
ncbi:MAG: tRNA (N6-isopentenyl adenosine(37)-C2)-methylthiotransferase MiaB [Candidatus Zixiibacteriota bacterium]